MTVHQLIPLIHRKKEEYIFFSFKQKVWKEIGSFRVCTTKRDFKSIRSLLGVNGFFTINSFFNVKDFQNKGRALYRRTEYVSSLNALYVDLDVGRSTGPTVEETIHGVKGLVSEGEIPPYNVLCESGRGIWLLWIFEEPVSADAKSLRLYSQMESSLISRLRDFCADRVAKDAVRSIRVPGTVHSVSLKRARYYLVDEDLRPWSFYEAALLRKGSPRKKRVLRKRIKARAGNRNPVPTSVSPRLRELNGSRLGDFELIESELGPWSVGKRRKALTIYAHLLRAAQIPYGKALKRMEGMGNRCGFPTSGSETAETITRAVYNSSTIYNYRNQTILDELEIKEADAFYLGLEVLKPKFRKARTRRKRKVFDKRGFVMRHFSKTCREISRGAKRAGLSISPSHVSRIKRYLQEKDSWFLRME